jgi:hypothetical protein
MKAQLHSLFVLGQKAGVDILPRHFYSSVPDIDSLKRTDRWKRPNSMIGIAGASVQSQVEFLRECCVPLRERLHRGDIYRYGCEQNGIPGYGPVEADVLFCFVSIKRPKRILQIGCGVSTAVIMLAAKEAGYEPNVVCVDPFPTDYITALARDHRLELVREPAESVDLAVLTGVDKGDLFFVDSTHAVRPGSEVNRIILEVLPRLKAGCFVHFHDIYFPYDYQASILSDLFFSVESTLLQAFLINNAQYSIAVSLSMLHHCCPDEMVSLFTNYSPTPMEYGLYPKSASPAAHFPSATYLAVS